MRQSHKNFLLYLKSEEIVFKIILILKKWHLYNFNELFIDLF